MNTEKKLEYFAETIAREIEEKKRKARQQLAAEMNETVSQAVAEAEAKAEQQIHMQRQAINKANNKRITEAKTQARRALTSLREQLAAELFYEIKTEIIAFTNSHDYESYLVSSIKAALLQSQAQAQHLFAYVQLPLSIAIPPLNGPDRAENSERFNAFSATGGADLKVNCYNLDLEHIQTSTGLVPEPGDESEIGGYRLLSQNRNIAVDNTFKSRLASAAEAFMASLL
ncbi:MAG: V-type proton ATPase subunit E [Defluviitaleaceae bacterium]|nr:V-type proton ATPase subunit E [Defluviitaleaceae bacterium]